MHHFLASVCALGVFSTVGNACLFSSGPAWNDLKVTWDPFRGFHHQPRTVKEAVSDGWEPVGPSECDGTSSYNGVAYVKGGDHAVVLIYDVNGFIAGIQLGISTSDAERINFPTKKLTPPFVLDGIDDKRYVVTAYFVEPSTICTKGRTQQQFDSQGTGTGLFLQVGNTPSDILEVPVNQDDVSAPWTEGNCFKTMGKHYWYNLSKDMDCAAGMPYFLLYNGGKLNGFGWAMAADLTSSYLEHPTSGKFKFFIKDVPQCFMDAPVISTMHIYFTSNPRFSNFC